MIGTTRGKSPSSLAKDCKVVLKSGEGVARNIIRKGVAVSALFIDVKVCAALLTSFHAVVSPLSILSNPMILIGGVTMILVFGMPYLMDNSKLEYRELFRA